jgi:hypothetical protein
MVKTLLSLPIQSSRRGGCNHTMSDSKDEKLGEKTDFGQLSSQNPSFLGFSVF